MSLRIITSLVFAGALCVLVPVASAEPVARVATAENFTQEDLLAELTRQLGERFQIKGELQLELTRPWTAIPTAAGSVETVLLDCPARLTSTPLVQIQLRTGSQSLGTFSLMLKAQLLRDVWVARAPIERGTTFDPSQLDVRRVDVLLQRDTIPTDGTENDFTYTTSIPAGRFLTWRDLTRRSLIRKGQIVEVSAIDGTLTITTKALAMENGAAGDTVKLRNIESKKDFSALVVAEARAQVRF